MQDPRRQPSEVRGTNPAGARAGGSLASPLFAAAEASPRAAAAETRCCRSRNLIETLEFLHVIVFDLQMHIIFLKITDGGKQAFSQKQHSWRMSLNTLSSTLCLHRVIQGK